MISKCLTQNDFGISGNQMRDNLDIDKELVRIYIARNNEYVRLEKEGKTREEILLLLQHYQDEIDAIIYPNGRKPEKKKMK